MQYFLHKAFPLTTPTNRIIQLFAIYSISLACVSSQILAQKKLAPIMMQEWRGEYFEPREGGIYFNLRSKSKSKTAKNYNTVGAKVILWNIINRKVYSVNVDLFNRPKTEIPTVWKLPSGKYRVLQVEIIDEAGNFLRWTAKSRKRPVSLIVKRQSISNAGLWVATSKEKKLEIKFKKTPNLFKENLVDSSSVSAVINAFTGVVEKNIAGQKIRNEARKGYTDNETVRATFTSTRSIGVFYTLDLFRHNHFGKKVSNVLQVADGEIRNCYLNGLERNDNIRGQVAMTFLLSKESGAIKKLQVSSTDIKDPEFIECLDLTLRQLQFSVPTNIIGKIVYKFTAS